MSHFRLPSIFVAIALSSLSGVANAHTGHGTSNLIEGLFHPFGPDHLLAMLAVGFWSIYALPIGKTWFGPVTFLIALITGAFFGILGFNLPYLEHAISLSITLFGVMILMVQVLQQPFLGIAIVASAGLLHGLAHGLEYVGANFASYAVGFLTTTALLHMTGLSMGLVIRKWKPHARKLMLGGLGVGLGGAGVYWFSQI